jgi:hypothetical protein
MFLVASLAFAYGIYPAAFSGPDALVVRNPLRTITLPWGVVTRLTAQLSFIAFTTTQRYTSGRCRSRSATGARSSAPGSARCPGSAAVTRAPRRSSPSAARACDGVRPPRRSGIEKLSYADQAVSEMGARREAWCTSQRDRPRDRAARAPTPAGDRLEPRDHRAHRGLRDLRDRRRHRGLRPNLNAAGPGTSATCRARSLPAGYGYTPSASRAIP